MNVAYADPPYPNCGHLYEEKREVDHAKLIRRLVRDYDGWVLHTSSQALWTILPLVPESARRRIRIMVWVKPFAAFKKNVSVAYAWEPILVRAVRKPLVGPLFISRDWAAVSATLKKGLVGAKPPDLCWWIFEVLGMDPTDELEDLYPGTGIVTDTWRAWRRWKKRQ